MVQDVFPGIIFNLFKEKKSCNIELKFTAVIRHDRLRPREGVIHVWTKKRTNNSLMTSLYRHEWLLFGILF